VGQYANTTEQYADKLPNATPENESQNTKHSIKWTAHLQRAQCAN